MKYILLTVLSMMFFAFSCEQQSPKPASTSGVKKATVKVKTGTDGLTVEQRNVVSRLKEDNKPGSIKHLYILSPYSGQALIYSTVKGKVTSGGKRLTPYSVAAHDGQYVGSEHKGIPIRIGNQIRRTGEVLQDDGTYGSSNPYIYWWDAKGIYHQHFFTGGQVIHVSDQPLPIKNVVLNLETK